VVGWAVDNRKLTKNPANAIKVKAQKKKRTRSKGFADDEAKAIFKACNAYVRKTKGTAGEAYGQRPSNSSSATAANEQFSVKFAIHPLLLDLKLG
jgi:hypothetical protein